MVTDRTAADVSEAIRIRREKIQQGLSLTAAELETLQRGMLTVTVMNRIETTMSELAELFNSMGYYNTPVSITTWTRAGDFRAADFRRWLDNTNILRTAFFVKRTTPGTPNDTPNYQAMNDIEQILHDMDVMINNIKSNYRRCGTFTCGRRKHD